MKAILSIEVHASRPEKRYEEIKYFFGMPIYKKIKSEERASENASSSLMDELPDFLFLGSSNEISNNVVTFTLFWLPLFRKIYDKNKVNEKNYANKVKATYLLFSWRIYEGMFTWIY